jgi:hypothetical protein
LYDTTMPNDRPRVCECPRCGEILTAAAATCGFCGHVSSPRKSALQRVADIAALVCGLTLVMALCALVAILTGL